LPVPKKGEEGVEMSLEELLAQCEVFSPFYLNLDRDS